MKLKEVYPDMTAQNSDFECMASFNPDNPLKWVQTIIGFANGGGGTIFVGTAKDGEAIGISLEEVGQVKQWISQIIDQYVFPHVKVIYQIRSVDDKAECFVLAAYIVPSSEDIVFKDEYAKSGFLMFSDACDQDDPMICGRLWKGTNKAGTVLDSIRLKGSLANVFSETLRFIERNTKAGWQKTENGGRQEVRSYPKEAVREALVNAAAHRDCSISGTQIDVDIYADRIEIVSHGSYLNFANLMERGGTGFQT
jgi:predicted HTH transcriptional regulator